MKPANLKQIEWRCPGITQFLEGTDPSRYSWVKTEKGELNLQTQEGLYVHSQKGAAKEARQWYEHLAPFDKQVLFIHGVGLGYCYETLRSWLQMNPRRFAVFLEDDPVMLKRFLETDIAEKFLHDPQIIFQFFPSPSATGWEAFRNQFAWLAIAFCNVPWDYASLPFNETHRKEETHLIGNQLRMNLREKGYFYSERVERFNLIFRNFFQNLPLIIDSLMAPRLYGKFDGVPCLICGAGPSLNNQIELIKTLENKAIILGSGTGFNILNRNGIFPHFGLCIDPYDIQESRQLTHFGYETPFFYQNRFYYKAASLIHGPKIYIGSMSYERFAVWFNKELELPPFENVEIGVTTTNVFSYMAVELGCEPLVLVGMDLSYKDKTRYAQGVARHGTDADKHAKHDVEVSTSTLKAVDVHGNPVETQWIWLEEAAQFSELAYAHPKKVIVNATDGGIKIVGIPYASLPEVSSKYLTRSYDLLNWIHAELQQSSAPKVTVDKVEKALDKWTELTKKGLETLNELANMTPEEGEKRFEEFTKTEIYQYFLAPFDQLYYGINLPDLEKLRLFADQFSEEVRKQGVKQAFESRINLLKIFLGQSLVFIEEGRQALQKRKLAPQPKIEPARTVEHVEDIELKTPFDDTLTLKYPNGQIKGEMHYKNGELHGPSSFYSPEGVLLAKSWFVEGKRVGKTLQYNLAGSLAGVLSFNQEGLRDGLHQFFYPSGELKTKMSFLNGVIDGEVKLYYPSGQIKRKLQFVKGKLEGTEQMWNEQGVMITEAEYKNNLPFGKTRTWHDNGQLSKEMIFYGSALNYDLSLWDEQGHLLHKSTTLPPEPLSDLRGKTQTLLESIKKMEAQLEDFKKGQDSKS